MGIISWLDRKVTLKVIFNTEKTLKVCVGRAKIDKGYSDGVALGIENILFSILPSLEKPETSLSDIAHKLENIDSDMLQQMSVEIMNVANRMQKLDMDVEAAAGAIVAGWLMAIGNTSHNNAEIRHQSCRLRDEFFDSIAMILG